MLILKRATVEIARQSRAATLGVYRAIVIGQVGPVHVFHNRSIDLLRWRCSFAATFPGFEFSH
jgi:hypothetical protein